MKLLKIDVDVAANDWDDIKYGGPRMLGFEFYVSDDIDRDEYEKMIRETLKKNNLPCLSIKFRDVPNIHTWTKEEIINCINENKNSF